jgi:hypothetical protein
MHVLNGGAEAPESHGDAPPPAKVTAAGRSGFAPPSSSELESLMQGTPEETLHSIAGLLPHNDRDAQRLKAVEIRALVTQGRLGTARFEARDYFERWPGGPDTADIEELTGIHPEPRRTAPGSAP